MIFMQFSPATQYVYDCYNKGTRPSGKKISLLGGNPDYQSVYMNIHGIDSVPKCECCGSSTNFVSFQKGFSKFCSKECSNAVMSRRNKEHNSERNKIRSMTIKKVREDVLKSAEQRYLNTNETIDEIAKHFDLPYYAVRTHLYDNGLTDSNRSYITRKSLSDKKFEDVNKFLLDEKLVSEKIGQGWTARNFADHLGCSTNYVAVFLRENTNVVLKNGSSYESTLSEYIESLGFIVIRNSRKIISPKEIDIYIPEKNLAIEINGSYWHSKHDKNYHLSKTEACESAGIHLLHVSDYEIDNNLDLVKSMISRNLGIVEKIYARKTEVKQIDAKTYREFCDRNHISKTVNAEVKLGLFYNDTLISVMSFSKPRFNKNYQYELIRFCTEQGLVVVGGASKLFKYFINNFSPKNVISYCNRRFFNGGVYHNIGMDLIGTTPPNYYWINRLGEKKTRYSTQKHKLETNLSESEYMEQSGFHRIFDSGNYVFSWG